MGGSQFTATARHSDGVRQNTAARTPIYFILLDEKGRMVQSMRRPDGVPPAEAKGFSFLREIQPILDRRCVACHSPAANTNICDLTSAPARDERSKRQWTRSYIALTHARAHGSGERRAWSGNPDHPMLNWISSGSVPTPHPPLTRGSRTSRLLLEKLDKGHAKGITDAELRLFSCWIDLGVPFCGDYEEANLWNDADRARWKTCVEKRRRDCCQ